MSLQRHTQPAKSSADKEPTPAKKNTTGVFLLNLGTPDAPETVPTRRYLKQFLSDPRVLDISPLGRYLLLRLIILPFRPAKSAAAYRSIWTDEGSPILLHGHDLTRKVQENLDSDSHDIFDVRLGMRYGSPSIESGLKSFQADGVDDIIVLPLYPQYASATVGSTIEEVYRVAATLWNVPAIQVLPTFYDNSNFIDAWRQVAEENFKHEDFDHVLFSFHGLPERHVRKSDLSGGHHCLVKNDCCETICSANRFCYRSHCLHTAKAIADAISLPDAKWTMTFQSRLGRDPWLKPYTDHVVNNLPSQGIKKLAIFSPAFIADCLETLEELGMQAVEDFKKAGGEHCFMVPSLNTHPAWVNTIVSMILDAKPINH